jgi:YD repeat-containing protein
VQTESGGSETFDIQTEVDATYLDIQPSGLDEMHGVLIDAATVLVDLQVSAVEHYSVTTDVTTVLIDLVASGVDLKGFQYTDTGSVYVNMVAITEHECIFHLEPSWHADGIRKWSWNGSGRRWAIVDTARRWAWVEGEGQPQIC